MGRVCRGGGGDYGRVCEEGEVGGAMGKMVQVPEGEEFISWLLYGPQAISRGLDAVKKVVEERSLTGVYGPLIENFKCEPRVFTAVEVTAGSRYRAGDQRALSVTCTCSMQTISCHCGF